MSYKIGLVGLPNVGKSSFFSFLTNKDVLIANYPFATIDKSVGIVSLDDFRIREMGRELGSKKITNSSFEIFDIAGLVKGASEGLGLGNEFLSSIREVDAIFHVLRCFEDKEVLHVEKSVNPVRDYEIIQTELILSDLQQVRKRIFKIKKKNIDEEELAVLKKVEKILEKDELLSTSEFSNRELSIIKRNNFLTLKPSMIIANYSSLDTELEVIKKLSREKNVNFFPISIKDEIEFKDLSEREKSELGWNDLDFESLFKKTKEALNLKTFITAGVKETRSWLIEKDKNAKSCGGKIHTDIEKNFIRLEIFNYNDWVNNGRNLENLKKLGLMRKESADYIVNDGDVCNFLFGKN